MFIKAEIMTLIDLYDEVFPFAVDETRAKDLENLIKGYFKHGLTYSRGMLEGWNNDAT